MINKTTYKNDQNFWNFFMTVIFSLVFAFGTYILYFLGRLPQQVSFFDTVIIIFAVFRLTRLFAYDKVMCFLRDFFIIKEEDKDVDGNVIITRYKYFGGFKRNISDLLGCPWCIGIWMSLFISFLFFISKVSLFPIFVLAIAGASSLIQIIINLIGWRAEQIKNIVDIDTEEDVKIPKEK